MTRADWYAQKHGGGWRVARKRHRCDCRPSGGDYCRNEIMPGERYFDTNERNVFAENQRVTKRFCVKCASGEV